MKCTNMTAPSGARYTSTVKEKIADFLHSRKGQDTTLVVVMLILAACSFGLGRLSANTVPQAPVTLYVPENSSTSVQNVAIPLTEPNASGAATHGTYVASRNGSVYHLPWCSGAQRINEENKVWFSTKEAAQAAGYRPAANCKGL
jgi:hypothetical protein